MAPTTSKLIKGIGDPIRNPDINNTTVYRYNTNVGQYGGYSRLIARIYLLMYLQSLLK